jgi:hypothetical protein
MYVYITKAGKNNTIGRRGNRKPEGSNGSTNTIRKYAVHVCANNLSFGQFGHGELLSS